MLYKIKYLVSVDIVNEHEKRPSERTRGIGWLHMSKSMLNLSTFFGLALSRTDSFSFAWDATFSQDVKHIFTARVQIICL